jgi:two-component system, NtrC family, sensor histidine kinase HydH
MQPGESTQPFNLLRWFAWLSPVVIILIALANAWLISNFLNNHLFQREASVTRDFVDNIFRSDGSLGYLAAPQDKALAEQFRGTVDHLTHMRDVLRANIYGADRTMVWSTDPTLIGKRFGDNEELEEAMHGELVVHAGRITHDGQGKDEHIGLDPSIEFFVESYIPLQRGGKGPVLGVVELYKAPLALTSAIREGQIQVGLTALGTALLLYATLFWMIRRADNTMKRQHEQLVETETLAVVGELTAAVAHNIRNPLSSIRSSAELALDSPGEDCSEQAEDIIREVDRISERITELLGFSAKNRTAIAPLDLDALLQQCTADHQSAFERRTQRLSYSCSATKPMISADSTLLRQVFHSLFSNAAEAMSEGGICEVGLVNQGAQELRIEIADTGSGISAEHRAQVFRPFFTSKPKGLGLGLPLAQRIIERYKGSIALDSRVAGGTVVTIILPRG